MSRRAVGSVLAVVLALSSFPPEAKAAVATVEVRSDFFKPSRIRIEPGDAIRWDVRNAGHSITSDDGSFDFPADASSGGQVEEGDQYEFVFERRGVFYFHCRFHGAAGMYPQGMTAAVYVGVPIDGPAGEVRRVPDEYPTIAAAQFGIPPGSTVSLAPGVYREQVRLTVAGTTVRGEGTPGDVVIEADPGIFTPAVEVTANGGAVENLSIRGAGFDALVFSAMTDFAARDLVIEGGVTGVRVRGAQAGVISGVRTTGVSQEGIAITHCNPCGVVVRDSVLRGARFGLFVDSAANVVVRNVIAVDNDVGINVIGSQGVDVIDSEASGGNVGIQVDVGLVPPIDVRIMENTVSGYANYGLKWDGLGVRVCFSLNRDHLAPDEQPNSQPPLLQVLFPCVV